MPPTMVELLNELERLLNGVALLKAWSGIPRETDLGTGLG